MVDTQNKLGIALVGLGSHSTTTLAPGILACSHGELRGLITDSRIKASMWTRKYNIERENVYSFQSFDEIAENHEIDIVYIASPNALHADYVMMAAKAKKHVICEKPLAISSARCKEMIAECDANTVKLSVGYRLCVDPHFRYLKSQLKKAAKGPCHIQGDFSFRLEDFSNWRFDKKLAGGGALMDLGIYGIYLSNFLFDSEPETVFVSDLEYSESGDVESAISFEMDFGGEKTARFNVSYSNRSNTLRINCPSKRYLLENAIAKSGLRLFLNENEIGLEGINQTATLIDDFIQAILNESEVQLRGELGLRDMQIVEAVYRSMRSKQEEKVELTY